MVMTFPDVRSALPSTDSVPPGSLALAVGGFSALAVVFGGLFLASTLPYVCVRRTCSTRLALQPTR
jgi:hypothetical protein